MLLPFFKLFFCCLRRYKPFLGQGAVVMFALFVLSAGSGCMSVYRRVVERSLGYRSPIGVQLERIRTGTPVAFKTFATLKVGASSLADALDVMGVPQKIRRTPTEEILEYHYLYARKSRFLFRPFFFLPYGSLPTYNYYGDDSGPDIVALVFDHQGRLKRKEFRQSAPLDTAGATMESVFVP